MNYLDLATPLPMAPLQFRAIQYAAPTEGTRLIVTGAVHGNETCGTRGILQVLQEFESGQLQLKQGLVTFVPITNPLAFQKRQRNGDRNLNRNLGPSAAPQEFEDLIGNWLCPLMAQHHALLDLHSFHTGGQPFAMVGPRNNDGPLESFNQAEAEQEMALRLGVTRFVDGWLDTYARGVARRVAEYGSGGSRSNAINTDARYGVGTTEYMRSCGGMAITLECGQHDDAQSPQVAYTAIKNTLANFGLIDTPRPAAVVTREMLSLYKVVDKIDPSDTFAKPWASFDAVAKGDLIGTRANGEAMLAQENGYIVFPNPKAEAGQEWFYLAKLTNRLQ